MILVIAASPACRLYQRRRDLAQQHLHDLCEFALLSCPRFDARSLGLEQAWLEILGSVRHSLVAPFLIRTPESLEAHRPPCVGSEEYRGETLRSWAFLGLRGQRMVGLGGQEARRERI